MTRLVVLAPHPDDETLGCGLLLATHPDPSVLHIVFVSDGAGRIGGREAVAAERAAEARAAAAIYGIREDHLHFLGFPDGQLMQNAAEIRRTVGNLLNGLGSVQVHAPFRYDQHPDHLAVNRVASSLVDTGELQADLYEYFVYARSRLVPGGDVRKLINPANVMRIEPEEEAAAKRLRAIECHRSQVTAGNRSIQAVLTQELIDRWSREDELHLRYEPSSRASRVLMSGRAWVPVATRVEPVLKRWSDRVRGRR